MGYAERKLDYFNSLKGLDLQKVGVYYSVNKDDLKEEFKEFYDFDEDSDTCSIEYCELDDVCDSYDSVYYDFTDERQIDDFFHGLMNYKQYNHYLVVLYNSTWRGATGYKIFNDYMDCFYRDYDCTMEYVDSSVHGKVLTLKEYHHDVPMGHKSVVIGLTDKEYELLDNSGFDTIIDFANKKA